MGLVSLVDAAEESGPALTLIPAGMIGCDGPTMTVRLFSAVPPDRIRGLFAQAMSDMYRAEVPLYGDLIALVGDINADTLQRDPALAERLQRTGETERLDLERHGAIRVMFCLGCEKAWTLIGDGLILRVLS